MKDKKTKIGWLVFFGFVLLIDCFAYGQSTQPLVHGRNCNKLLVKAVKVCNWNSDVVIGFWKGRLIRAQDHNLITDKMVCIAFVLI